MLNKIWIVDTLLAKHNMVSEVGFEHTLAYEDQKEKEKQVV